MSISVSKQFLQIAKRNLPNFDENTVNSFPIEILRHLNALSTPFYTPNLLQIDFSVETIPANRKTQSFKFRRTHCYFDPDWDITAVKRSFHSIDTPNVKIANFSAEAIPANRKTQSFKFLRNLCYFVPDWDITPFKRSFHSILHAECSTCRFHRLNNSCKSQNAIFQISTKSLLFRSRLRYYAV
jgi:hypothetical protein